MLDLPTYLPPSLPTYLPTDLATYLLYLPTHLPTYDVISTCSTYFRHIIPHLDTDITEKLFYSREVFCNRNWHLNVYFVW